MDAGAACVAVAGHCCLDIFPTALEGQVAAGRLVGVGPALFSPGGCVCNTGLALRRLGTPVRLFGKVGPDQFGANLLDLMRRSDDDLVADFLVSKRRATSYSIVLSQPGLDRCFLHHEGANATFKRVNLDFEKMHDVRILHFGYPPLMLHIFSGDDLVAIYQEARKRGMLTTLDMSLPDVQSDGAQTDWPAWLQRHLPYCDVFLPSRDELLWFLRETDDAGANVDAAMDWCLSAGAECVVVKCGADGMCMKLKAEPGRIYRQPAFQVDHVKGTTGSGDASVAGFLTILLEDPKPSQRHLEFACAVGACCVEALDATSGIPEKLIVEERIRKWKLVDVESMLLGK